MALDEPSDNDEIHSENDFKVIIDKDLLGHLGGVDIDYRESRWMGSGFSIRPVSVAPAGACSC